MKRLCWLVVALVVVAVTGSSQQAAAQNDSAATAITIPPDGSPRSGSLYGGQAAWFVANLKGGHSYVITATEGNQRATSHTGSFVSGFIGLTVYESDGTTDLLSAMKLLDRANPAVLVYDATLGDNHFAGGWRFSYVPTTTQDVFLRVHPLYATNASDSVYYRVSIIDTTLGCIWYYTSSDYESFMEVTNTSDVFVNFTAQHYRSPTTSGGAAAAVGSAYSFLLAPNGTVLVGARATAAVPAGSRGGAKITHDGPPGSIKANVTTINVTGIGLTHSFNTACEPAFSFPSVGSGY